MGIYIYVRYFIPRNVAFIKIDFLPSERSLWCNGLVHLAVNQKVGEYCIYTGYLNIAIFLWHTVKKMCKL